MSAGTRQCLVMAGGTCGRGTGWAGVARLMGQRKRRKKRRRRRRRAPGQASRVGGTECCSHGPVLIPRAAAGPGATGGVPGPCPPPQSPGRPGGGRATPAKGLSPAPRPEGPRGTPGEKRGVWGGSALPEGGCRVWGGGFKPGPRCCESLPWAVPMAALLKPLSPPPCPPSPLGVPVCLGGSYPPETPKFLLFPSCLGCSPLTLCLPAPCRGRRPGTSEGAGTPEAGVGRLHPTAKPRASLLAWRIEYLQCNPSPRGLGRGVPRPSSPPPSSPVTTD